jgi:DNA ligase (NAD+)
MFKLTKPNIEKLKKNPLEILKTLSEDQIASIIQQANSVYRNENKTIISDNIYDMIWDYLTEKNPNHPILKKIGEIVDDDKRKEALPYFMGSLDKIKGEGKEIEKFKVKYPGSYMISDKLDGNSGLLYSNKKTVKLFTRGDGSFGQNISHILQFIKNVPDMSKQKGEIAIRGELIISKAAFEKLKDKGANARNMVAGMLNAKVPDIEIARAAEFVAYELINPKLEPDEQFKFMSTLGFNVAFNKNMTEDQLTNEALSTVLMDRRDTGPYDIDGIVVMHNKVHKRISEGNPSYGFAFKSIHTMQRAEIIVTNVEWNLSKDGYMVPVVNFMGVNVDGVVIRRATGFNGKFIKDNKIGPGSRLVIMRAGLVIPTIVEILSPSETGEPQMPDSKFIWSKSGVDIMLSDENKKDNNELKFKNFENFFVKIDIPGLGPGNLKKMFDSGFNTVKAVFDASISDLLKVDGFKDKSATKIHDALHERIKTLDCITIMDASNTMGRGLGSKKIDLILKEIPAILEERYIPTISELVSLKGIEKLTATVFTTNLPAFFKFVDDNNLNCFVKEKNKPAAMEAADKIEGPTFENEMFVFTGFRNKTLEDYITLRGGTILSGVTKNATKVLCKDIDEDSGKMNKAKTLKIKIEQVDDFIKKNKIIL